jgi:hypothetical protein
MFVMFTDDLFHSHSVITHEANIHVVPPTIYKKDTGALLCSTYS